MIFLGELRSTISSEMGFTALPLNSMFFTNDLGGYYITPVTNNLMSAMSGGFNPIASRFELPPSLLLTSPPTSSSSSSSSPSEININLNPNQQLIEKNRISMNHLIEMKSQITSLHQSSSNNLQLMRFGKLCIKQQQLENLKKQLQEAKLTLHEEEEQELKERQAMNEMRDLKEDMVICSSLQKEIQLINEVIQLKMEELMKTQFLLEVRQIRLLHELQMIFPIEQLDNGEHSIRGLELPYDLFLSKDDETLSSALGYVVHVMILIGKYFEITYRYQLLFFGSRSSIRDPLLVTYPVPLANSLMVQHQNSSSSGSSSSSGGGGGNSMMIGGGYTNNNNNNNNNTLQTHPSYGGIVGGGGTAGTGGAGGGGSITGGGSTPGGVVNAGANNLQMSPGGAPIFPLYRKGVDRERFERGIYCLKKNVEQLLLTRKIVFDFGRDILYNLKQLFISEISPSLSL